MLCLRVDKWLSRAICRGSWSRRIGGNNQEGNYFWEYVRRRWFKGRGSLKGLCSLGCVGKVLNQLNGHFRSCRFWCCLINLYYMWYNLNIYSTLSMFTWNMVFTWHARKIHNFSKIQVRLQLCLDFKSQSLNQQRMFTNLDEVMTWHSNSVLVSALYVHSMHSMPQNWNTPKKGKKQNPCVIIMPQCM